MAKMADPMNALRSYQQALDSGAQVDPNEFNGEYMHRRGVVESGKRFDFVKIVNREVQALAIFGEEAPIEGVPCFNVGYAVSEKYRRRGLAVEAVNKGIEEFKKEYSRYNVKSFIVDAIIAETNMPSIKVAEKLFPGPRKAMKDVFSGTPSLYFKKLIEL